MMCRTCSIHYTLCISIYLQALDARKTYQIIRERRYLVSWYWYQVPWYLQVAVILLKLTFNLG